MPTTDTKKSAIIVDDFPSVQFYHSFVLEKAGFHCRVARNGQEALKLLRTEKADLIVLDLRMPEMNGQEFVTHLHQRAELARVPVLIISTEQAVGDRIRKSRTASTGPVGFAIKPVLPDKIISEVQQLMVA